MKSTGIYRITLISNFMAIEQGLFKAMILNSLSAGDKNSIEIFEHIVAVPYSYKSSVVEYQNILYTGSIEALRVELVYLRKHGFITKTNKTRLLNYALTALGKQNVESPFKFVEIFEERVQAEVEKRTASIIHDQAPSNLPTVKQITSQPSIHETIERDSILNLGSENEVGINVSDDPSKHKFITLTITKGVPALST